MPNALTSFKKRAASRKKVKSAKKEIRSIQKKQKVRSTKVRKYVSEVIPYTDVHEDGYLLMKKGVCGIFKLKCHSILSASEDEQESAFTFLNIFYKAYMDDLKFVSMNFPADTSEQLRYVREKKRNTKNRTHYRFLEYKEKELELIESEETDRDFYLFLYARDGQDYENKLSILTNQLQKCFPVESLPLYKKISVLFKMYNPNVKLISQEQAKAWADASVQFRQIMNDMPRNVRKVLVNPFLLSAIQPRTNLKAMDRCIKKGDGFESCIHVYEYPKTADSFWLNNLMNLNNTITVMDIATPDQAKAEATLERSIKEVAGTDTEDVSAIEDASKDASRLLTTRSIVKDQDDILKHFSIRIYVNARTEEELAQKVRDTIISLESTQHRCAVYLGEEMEEWLSMMLPYTEQVKLQNKRLPNDSVSSALAIGYPFNYSSLSDPQGFYLAKIIGGGHLVFNTFHNDSVFKYTIRRRLSYDSIMVGKKGSGKSTTLKKLIEHTILEGNKVRGIDVANEFGGLVEGQGGLMINMDGTQGLINLLEVFSVSKNEVDNFAQHMSKMSKIYQLLNPDATNSDCLIFKKLIRKLYEKFMLIKFIEGAGEDENEGNYQFPHGKITGLEPTAYPIFSDLLALVHELLYKDVEKEITHPHLTEKRKNQYQDIADNLENIIMNYGHIFDGHSSLQDLSNEQVVFFNVRSLTEMESSIFAAQMLNILILIWGGMMSNGAPQKKQWDAGLMEWEEVIKYLIVIDEAHRIINPEYEFILDYINNFVKEARKYFAGTAFATPSMRLFVPDNASDGYVDKLNDLFEMTTYKFIMLQDANAIPSIKRVLGSHVTDSELAQIPYYNQGESLLSITGTGNYHIRICANPEELRMFGGGA